MGIVYELPLNVFLQYRDHSEQEQQNELLVSCPMILCSEILPGPDERSRSNTFTVPFLETHLHLLRSDSACRCRRESFSCQVWTQIWSDLQEPAQKKQTQQKELQKLSTTKQGTDGRSRGLGFTTTLSERWSGLIMKRSMFKIVFVRTQ